MTEMVETTVMPDDQLAALLTVIAGAIGVIFVIWLIWTVLQVIACWRIFGKAGEAGWKSIIPIYGEYTMYKITWNTLYFWVYIGLALAGMIVFSLAEPDSALRMVAYLISTAATVVNIIDTHKLSKAFGHGVGFTLGLIFLSPIFRLILAFGSDAYQGPQ